MPVNPATQEAEAVAYKFEASLGSLLRSCLKIQRARGVWFRGSLVCVGLTFNPHYQKKKIHTINKHTLGLAERKRRM